MAFLSLGLHNDEPPTSGHAKNESPREREPNSSAHDGSLQSAKQSGNGNGHAILKSTQELDGFEADHFDDELNASEAETKLATWMSAVTEQLRHAVPPNG